MKRNYIKRIKKHLPESWLLLGEMWRYWRRLCKYNASFSTDNDINKMQYTLARENHVIEKGLSMNHPRKGFGQQKVTALINRLSLYYDRYGKIDAAFLNYPLSTIKAYIAYQHQDNIDISRIDESFATLCTKIGVSPDSLTVPAGIEFEKATDLQNKAKGDFESLLFSRHSIRYFEDEIPSKNLIEEAMRLSAQTPSACNRQAWHTHVYYGNECHSLLEMQGGCQGFYHDIPCCIVVTADMKGFLHYEPFQCYIDGGLYAMNLINALTYVGLGTIPLSCGFYTDKLSAIQKAFDIPANEAMILIIGLGVLTKDVKVAKSTRRPIEMTNTFHSE